MREHSVARDEALEALIDEGLLVAEARRRGFTIDEALTRRAAARELLNEIESALPPSSVSLQAIRAEYDETVERMAESDPNVVVPPFDESISEIRTMLVGRSRFARLETLLSDFPTLNEERVSALLSLPAVD